MIDSQTSPKRFCVYCHTNKINGKRYVGITCKKPNQRWIYGKGYKHNAHLTNAFKKYGWDNFDHDIIISDVDEDYAKSFEKMLINLYHSADRRYGYNKSTGGESGAGVEFSEERRRKISEALTGIKRSEETKKKISEVMKNRPSEMKYNFAHCRSGKTSWNRGIKGEASHSYGVVFSEERKKHLSEALKGKPKSPEHRAKLCTPVRCISTGVVYASVKEAAKAGGVSAATISNNCRKKVRYQKWEYEKKTS
jgi:group I intron endonuclease